MIKKSGNIVRHTAAELRATEKRGDVKTNWKAAAKTPPPSGRDPDDAMEEIDCATTKLPKPRRTSGDDIEVKILNRVLAAYRIQIVKETFNGVKLQEINADIDDASLRKALVKLVRDRKIDVISSATQLNPHIKRLPAPSVVRQLETLDVTEKYHTCLYPTPLTIQETFDLSFLDDKPFSLALAEGSEQLKPEFFELGVLDRYQLDPRYLFQFSEYAGQISILSDSDKTGPTLERDQISIQTFGLGIDNADDAVVCVFLRYLSNLTPEHQRHWQTHLSSKPALMHENYYKPSLLGEFWENNSAIAAIRFSVNSINKICDAIWGKALFLNEVPSEVHYNLSPFMRATKADFLSFAHELDKLISENLNPSFFDDKVDAFRMINHPDGTMERVNKGTLARLDEWLCDGTLSAEDVEKLRNEIIRPLRRVRQERQSAAHKIIKNEFDKRFTYLKRELLLDAAFALGNIFFILSRNSLAPTIRVPKWFEEGRIEVF